MSYLALFSLNVLIWGSTWFAIKYQVTTVSPLWSVAYRFGLAALILFTFCLYTGRKIKLNRQTQALLALQGLLLFCLNYILYYLGTTYLISGLVAMMSASAIFFNLINARLFFKMPIVFNVVAGACLGIVGLGIVLSGELSQMSTRAGGSMNLVLGISCCLVATFMASLGNMVAVRLNQLQAPLLPGVTISMCYGAVFTAIIALVTKQNPTISFNLSYIISLLYLALFGSVIAFACYLTLLSRIGPAKASYISIITPVIAMLLSTLFEGFVWKLSTLTGIILIIYGNVLVLAKRQAVSETK